MNSQLISLLLHEKQFASPSKTIRNPNLFREFLLEDGKDHTIRIVVETDGPFYQELKKLKEWYGKS